MDYIHIVQYYETDQMMIKSCSGEEKLFYLSGHGDQNECSNKECHAYHGNSHQS